MSCLHVNLRRTLISADGPSYVYYCAACGKDQGAEVAEAMRRLALAGLTVMEDVTVDARGAASLLVAMHDQAGRAQAALTRLTLENQRLRDGVLEAVRELNDLIACAAQDAETLTQDTPLENLQYAREVWEPLRARLKALLGDHLIDRAP